MNALWKKELRLLMPATVAVIALAWVALFAGFSGDGGSNCVVILFAGAAGIGALGYGQEMEHHTLDLQLALPISRRRLWWTKLATLFLPGVLLVVHLWMICAFRARYEPRFTPEFEPYLLWVTLTCFGATLFSWRFGSIIGGAAVGGLASIVWFGLVEPTLWIKVVARTSEEFAGSSFGERSRWLVSAGLVGIVALVHYRSWMRGEIRGRRSAEEGMHNWFLARAGIAPHPRRPVLNLIVKEVRLQTPAIFVALVCVAFSLLTFACWSLFPEDVQALEIYKAGGAVVIAIVPLLIGCTALAEERSLRSLQPLVALPRAWATMFQLKAATSCVLALLLGAVLPMALEGIPGGNDLNPPILAVVVFWIWAIGLFSGSVSTGTVRAVLFACGFSVPLAFFWRGAAFVFARAGGGKFVSGVWDFFPSIDPRVGERRLSQIVVETLCWIVGCLFASVLIAYARKLGRQPDVTKPQIITCIAAILAITTPLVVFVIESIDQFPP